MGLSPILSVNDNVINDTTVTVVKTGMGLKTLRVNRLLI